MGEIRQPSPVLRIAAVFTRHADLFEWARMHLESRWGRIVLEHGPFPFDYTSYYEKDMGQEIDKCFWAFEVPVDPAGLPDWKIETNRLEETVPAESLLENRPINIDPGYVTEAKLVLATTKDRDHRVYLRDGIFAEVTLHFQRGEWSARPWTYPDYSDANNIPFFDNCRDKVRQRS